MNEPPLLKPLLFALALASQAFADFTPADSAKAAAYCQGGSFLSTTVLGKTPDNARAKAKAEIARNIISDIKSSVKTADYSEEKGGVLKESSRYSESSEIESSLTLLGLKEAEAPRRQKNGEYELRVYVCVRDVAKPYLEKQRILSESMEASKDWHKIQSSWNEFMGIQILLESLGTESIYADSAKKLYEKAREEHKENCNARLHWNPERQTSYSEIAFSKLSGSVKMETSPCKGRGVLLAYKGAEPECSVKFGVNTCSCTLSLTVSSCNGTEYLQLKNNATGVHQRQDFALDKLQSNLKSSEFWDEWIQEIKQWSPQQCE